MIDQKNPYKVAIRLSDELSTDIQNLTLTTFVSMTDIIRLSLLNFFNLPDIEMPEKKKLQETTGKQRMGILLPKDYILKLTELSRTYKVPMGGIIRYATVLFIKKNKQETPQHLIMTDQSLKHVQEVPYV